MSSLTTNYLVVFLIGAVAAAESMIPADVEAEALAADDTCAAGSTGCSLNALQRKGRSFLNLEAKLRQPVQSLRMHRHKRRRHRETAGHINDGRLEGAAFADYSVDATIGGRTFQVIVDTGSSEFAVAASSGDGCWEYYSGPCTNQSLAAYYGSGSWQGYVCGGPEVHLAGLSAGTPVFAGITEQDNFLTKCSQSTGIVNEGIVGMAYQGLISGFDAVPLFDSVVETTGVPNIFSMQCCGWHGGEAAGGQLVLGGVDSQLYTGEFQFTPVTKELYFCVELEDIYVEGYPRPPPMPVMECQSFPFIPCFMFPCGDAYASCNDGICQCPSGQCFNATGKGMCSSPGDMSMRELGASTHSATDDKVQDNAGVPGCPAIIDSGTSEIILTPEHYHRVMHVLQPLSNQLTQNAFCIVESMLESFPTVTIQLGGNVVLSVPPTTYLQPHPNESGCYLLFIGRKDQGPSIIGQPLMEAYYTVFDKETARVGFAPIAGCD